MLKLEFLFTIFCGLARSSPILCNTIGEQIMVMEPFSTGIRSCRHLHIGMGLRSLSGLNNSILALSLQAIHFPL